MVLIRVVHELYGVHPMAALIHNMVGLFMGEGGREEE